MAQVVGLTFKPTKKQGGENKEADKKPDTGGENKESGDSKESGKGK